MAIALMMYLVDPLITGSAMDIGGTLGTLRDHSRAAGGVVLQVFHGVVLLPMGFAFLSVRLRGPDVVKGLIWGAILWALTEALVTPHLGSGFFGETAGGPRTALISLVD
jgi:hypothetical protein